MFRYCDWTTLRSVVCHRAHHLLLAAALVGTALLIPSFACAASIDFNAVTGNYDSTLDPGPPHDNWITTLDGSGTDVSIPATTDDAYVRNNGTVSVTTNVQNNSFRIGASNVIQVPDPNDPNVLIDMEIGMPGTLDWTAGEITGDPLVGPVMYVGERDNTNDINFTGTVYQNGATTKISLPLKESVLTIGRNGSTPTPTSTYNLMDGTIGLVIEIVGVHEGSNGNNGINVRNGTFTMSGGSIIDETNPGVGDTLKGQRFLTISSTSGSLGSENVATANFTGGSVDVLGGIRVASSSNSRGYLNIAGLLTGPVMQVGEEVSIGYNANNGVGEMNMSNGQLTIGTASNTKKLQIGQRGTGSLNQSGGSIEVTNDLIVGGDAVAGGSIYMTGGTLTTRGLVMRESGNVLNPSPASSIIIDHPSAVFSQGQGASAGTATIGKTPGQVLFEVRQGSATLSTVELGANSASTGVINLTGGKLKITGPVLKTNAAATPAVNLTGGTLEVTPSAVGTTTWSTDLVNNGAEMILNPNTVQQVSLLTTAGSATNSSFAMNSGIWDLEIGSNIFNSGADRVIVTGAGTAAITGGTINISHINSYVPQVNDLLRIVRAATGGVTLNAGAVTLLGDPNWRIITDVGNTEIDLKYVPEPASCVLVLMGLMMGMVGFRRRS